MNDNEEPMLTEAEAAKLLHIEPVTLATWRCTKRHNIPYYKLGRSVRYRKSDLIAWQESCRVEHKPQT